MPEPSGSQDVKVASTKRRENSRLPPERASMVRTTASLELPLWMTAAIRSPSGDHDGAAKKAGTKNSGDLTLAITRRLPSLRSAAKRDVVPGSGYPAR